MHTPLVAPHPSLHLRPSTLHAITVAALLSNALLFGADLVARSPNEINVPHVMVSLVFAGIAALRFHWAPAFGTLLGVGQLAEGYVHLGHIVAEVDSAAAVTTAVLFFAIPVVALVSSIGAMVLHSRARLGRALVDPPASV